MLVAIITLGACTAQAQAPQVPTAQQPATTNPTTPTAESNYDRALRFARCMNEALDVAYPGLGDRVRRVPDPVEGEPLQTYVAVPHEAYKGKPVSAVMDAGSGQWAVMVPEIFERCKHHLPAMWPVKADPDDLARFGRFYECLRQRGIDVPAPDANGVILSDPNPQRRDTPEYRAAEQACRHLADDPAVRAGDH